MEDRIKELLSDENYVKALLETGSYEAAAEKLKEDGVEVSVDELKNAVELITKKQQGELDDEALEEVYGGVFIASLITLLVIGGVFAGISVTLADAAKDQGCK